MRKICKFKGCGRYVYAHGICWSHYSQKKYYGFKRLKPIKKVNWNHPSTCTFPGCNGIYWAGGLCKNHYGQKFRGYELIPLRKKYTNTKCRFKNCSNRVSIFGYCDKHYHRYNRHGNASIVKSSSRGGRGAANVNWNNGASEYPNHYQMKQARLQILGESKYKCRICKGKASYVHHIDKTKHNHKLSNLIAICAKCHKKLHPNHCPRKYPDECYKIQEKTGITMPTILKYRINPESIQDEKRMLIDNFLHKRSSS